MNFRTFLLGFITVIYSTPSLAFDAGEHAILGDMAMAQYFPEYENRITNLEADIDFRYGHLIAMSGDMYKSIEEMALDEPSYLKDYYLHNRKKLKECIDKEIRSIRESKEYEKCSETRMVKRKFRYLTLAHDNYSHFAWHNIKNYINFHEKALWFAQLAYLKCDKKQWNDNNAGCKEKSHELKRLVNKSSYKKRLSKKYEYLDSILARRRLTKKYLIELSKKKMIDLALFANSYADHFLSDAFSSGHLRVPRSQIDAFVDADADIKQLFRKSKREEGSVISGALTQYLHNLDGDLVGVQVKNSRGEEFILRGDKQLFAVDNGIEMAGEPDKQMRAKLPIEAIGLSLKEVFDVIENGNYNSLTTYTALQLVPFVDFDKEKSLQEIVSGHIEKEGSVKAALDKMSPEMKNLYRSAMLFEDLSYKKFFTRFSQSIDPIMQKFRRQIEKEMEEERWAERIPKALKTALVNIR
ncbi:hypothetical protein [Pleionea sediminis]|uniref:hypothetical protein n=1 Tax=Pleionea sediminis TaxID=2569479 RepID=UPI0011848D55|nr:hypothetical protein [Pleionea sediminis]